KSQCLVATDMKVPVVKVAIGKNKKQASEEEINLTEFIEVKGWKAIGNKLTGNDLISIELLEPNPELEADEEDNNNTPSEPETDAQIHLINDDIEQEEKEKIDKLLQDEPEQENKPRFKKKQIPPTEQPKLF
ncbi:MAG: hypothetical protein NTU43_00535, partial [Bacteroidetes bacterium]|nr:hypothetical protein [Bacteroidota bacterium]